jgi:hypothetical protein
MRCLTGWKRAAEERRELRTDVESMGITLDGLTLALASKRPLEGFES